MSDDKLSHAHQMLVRTLTLAADEVVLALHQVSQVPGCDLAMVADAIFRTERMIAVARVQLATYEENLDIAAILHGIDVKRDVADWFAKARQ
jgi:hypothetical protein